MASFENPKHVHENILELKAHLKSNLNLIQWLDEEN
jgi:hypothetical protein